MSWCPVTEGACFFAGGSGAAGAGGAGGGRQRVPPQPHRRVRPHAVPAGPPEARRPLRLHCVPPQHRRLLFRLRGAVPPPPISAPSPLPHKHKPSLMLSLCLHMLESKGASRSTHICFRVSVLHLGVPITRSLLRRRKLRRLTSERGHATVSASVLVGASLVLTV